MYLYKKTLYKKKINEMAIQRMISEEEHNRGTHEN